MTTGIDLSGTGMAVVVTLVLLSVWSLMVAADRLITFTRARRQSHAFARALAVHTEQGWLQGAIETAGRFPHSHLARVVSAGLVTFQKKSVKGSLSAEEVIEAAERALERSTLKTTVDLQRGLTSLATIATTAPFIGLFGTVIGIMHAFDSLGEAGAGGFAVVSQGIAEALATTALGILVAIPAAWMFNYLTHRVEGLSVEMTSSSSELVDFFRELRSHGAD
ncbi:MAG TPA: MotA/TolQ/ExbB proton channel family protein [Thermoanaerobaculia bacterium]|nr:MotA/TolQ/ExbB proton channel family protein [Thermoanaerobaculia bacterium]